MQQSITHDATLSTITLLVIANSALTIVAGYFLRDFVRDVRKLTETVQRIDKRVAVLAAVIKTEIKHFSEEE